MKKLLFLWKQLLSTFWFVPILIVIGSVVLAIGFLVLDSALTLPQDGLTRYFLVSSAASARSVLSIISGAMISVAGTVFSVTLVALTLASSQYGSRLINNFMYVRLNQVVLGSYIATYLYCLVILNAIKGTSEYTFIPAFSVLVAILAAVLNIVLLIIFIHRIAVSIQAENVIADISDFISKRARVLFPEKLGDELDKLKEETVTLAKSGYPNMAGIEAHKSGYLKYLDTGSLMAHMVSTDRLLELHVRPGDYLVEGSTIGYLYSNTEISEEDTDRVVRHLITGKKRTPEQDIEFSIKQMVEVASRALSPGVNDPHTAITCIDNLTATMCYLAQVKFPSKYRFDEDNALRVIAHTPDFEGVMDAAFNQIRQYSAGNPAVIIRLMEALVTINGNVQKKSYRNAVIKHAEMVLNVGKSSIREERDFKDLEQRAEQILNVEAD